MPTWVTLASLIRAKTLSGGLVAHSAAGLPFLLYAGLEVAFVPPRHDAPRRGVVERVRYEGKGAYLVFFEGITSIEVAEMLVGCSCLARRSDVPPHMLSSQHNGLIGYEICDACANVIGTVAEVKGGGAQTLLSVARTDGKGEVLIPLVDAFVTSFDESARRIVVALPDGLLDL